MSDSSDSDISTVQMPESENSGTVKKQKREYSAEHKAKLKENMAKAREARAAKHAAKLAKEEEDKRVLNQIIAERKTQREPAPPAPFGSKTSKKKKEPVIESSSDEEEEEEEDQQESESEESSSSSEEEAEFVLKRRKATASKAKSTKVAKSVKAAKSTGVATAKELTMLQQLEQMAAEIAALKKEKKKNSKVNVYVNQPEPKKMSDVQKQKLLDL